MRKYVLPDQLDLLVCHGCLHLIPRDDWQVLIPALKDATKSGGIHAVGCFTNSAPEPRDQKGLMVGLFEEGELAAQYSDWEILKSDAQIWEHEQPDGPRHKHAANSLIAMKPE